MYERSRARLIKLAAQKSVELAARVGRTVPGLHLKAPRAPRRSFSSALYQGPQN